MFSFVCVCLPKEGSHMTIAYDVLDLTVQGLHPHPHPCPDPPSRYATSLYRDPLPSSPTSDI